MTDHYFALKAQAARQGGVFSCRDTREHGVSASELKRLTGFGGAWHTVRRGVYVTREHWQAANPDERYCLAVHAAALTLSPFSLPSHTSAAALLGFPLLDHWRRYLHVTRDRVHGGRSEHGVKQHVARFTEDDLHWSSGTACLGPARTAVDIGREFGFADGVVACDAALRSGTSRKELESALASMRFWPGVRAARTAVQVADGGAANPGESLMRVLLMELGLGEIYTQVEIEDGGRRARVDALIEDHIFEFDGRVKYRSRAAGGVAEAPAEDVVWAEKQREDWLRSLGFTVSRVLWRDLFGDQREATKARLRREFHVRSDVRRGTSAGL